MTTRNVELSVRAEGMARSGREGCSSLVCVCVCVCICVCVCMCVCEEREGGREGRREGGGMCLLGT